MNNKNLHDNNKVVIVYDNREIILITLIFYLILHYLQIITKQLNIIFLTG